MYQFNVYSNLCLIGPSFFGKTTLMKNILLHLPELFEKPILHVYYCSGTKNDDEIECSSPLIKHMGLPTKEMLNHRDSMIILDDLQMELGQTKNASQYASQIAHHAGITFCYLFQSLYWKNEVIRQILLNTQYLIFLSCRRNLGQVRTFLQGNFPSCWKKRLAIHEAATKIKFSHILYDFHPFTEEANCVRSQILPHQICQILDMVDGVDSKK